MQDLSRKDLTIEELVDGAQRLLKDLAPRQTRYKVTERPDVRTIRYYTSQGLLPKPASYQGGRARYTGSHLLRLLLIKKLQSEHHTLGRIARVLQGATDDWIRETLLGEGKDDATTEPRAPEPSPAPKLESTPVRRVALGAGATLDIPEAVIDDPRRRSELASQLEEIARELRERASAENKNQKGGK